MSRSSSSTSSKPPVSYKLLLGDPERWVELAALFRSSQWAALGELMEAERLSHLEALVASGSQVDQAQHLAVARWIGQFMDTHSGVAQGLLDEHRAARESAKAVDEHVPGGTEWMAPDSGTDEENLDAS